MVCLCILSLFLRGVWGEESNDLSLEYYAGSPLFVGKEYDSLFRVRNLGHKTGEQDSISVMIYYTVYDHDVLVLENTSQIEGLNSYTTKNIHHFGICKFCNYFFLN